MTRRRHKKMNLGKFQLVLSLAAVLVLLLVGTFAAEMIESRMTVEVENAGMQMTAHKAEETAQVFMNGQWYEKRKIETLLVMGIDGSEVIGSSNSYNNANQADFLILLARDLETGESSAIHLNRDTMTDITVLGVTGQAAGTRHAQLALAYTYGRGEEDSSRNTVSAVSHLLYGMKIDHYITVTMAAVAKMNDWVGGVEVEILDDFGDIDSGFVKGEKVRLSGEQALTYVRTRKGLDESTNLKRMTRQRQYATAWLKAAEPYLKDTETIAELVIDIEDYHYSDCTMAELAEIAESIGDVSDMKIYEVPGEAVKGKEYMEYYADEEKLQQLVLQLFFRQAE